MPLSRTHRIAVLAAVVVLVGVSVAAAFAALTPGEPPGGRLLLIASFYPVWEFTSRVAGDDVRVELLVPSGVDPHDWEPTPGDVALVAAADLVVYVHPSFETFVPQLLEAAPTPPPAVATAEGLDLLRLPGHEDEEDDEADLHDEEVDPHIWLDPLLAMDQVRAIRDALLAVDPAFAERYEANADALLADLQALHVEIEAGLKGCALGIFITVHASFRYFALRYGLVNEYISVDPEVGPSPTRIRELVELAQEHGIAVIFTEPLLPSGAAEVIAEAIEGETLPLDPLEGLANPDLDVGPNHFTLMRLNLANLRAGLGCL